MNKINIEKLEYLRKQQEKLRKHDSTNQNNNYYESNIEKYKRRCIEYIEFLKTTKRNIGVYDEIYFSDGIDMYSWYYYEVYKYNKENDEGLENLSEGRILRRKMFEEIRSIIIDNELSFEEKTRQYIKKIKELKRNLTQEDKIMFENSDKDMYSWFIYYDQKFNKEREIEEIPTGERLEKLICFANIYNELNDIKKLKKTI